MKRGGPLSELAMTAFHYRARHNGEVLTARRSTATIPAQLLGSVMLLTAAFRANWAIRPARRFEPLPGGFFIVEMGCCKLVLGHRGLSNGLITSICALWCQLRNSACWL
jgi:hypothetical protein